MKITKIVNILRRLLGMVPVSVYDDIPSTCVLLVKFKYSLADDREPKIKWPNRKSNFIYFSREMFGCLEALDIFEKRLFDKYQNLSVIDHNNARAGYLSLRSFQRALKHAIRERVIIPELGGVIDSYQEQLNGLNTLVGLIEDVYIRSNNHIGSNEAITFIFPPSAPTP